jgi:hypothetical protein
VSVQDGQLGREDVAQLGDVQTGEAKGVSPSANTDMEHFVGVSKIEL